MIVRKTPTQETLENIVRTINSIIKKDDCYYTKEELKEIKRE